MNKKILKKATTLFFAFFIAISPITAMAAPTSNGALEGSNAADNETDVNNDLADFDIIDKDKRGSITIHKYDFTSADEDGVDFNYSETDHDSNGTASTLTKDGKSVDITSNGKKNAEAEEALKEYALKGVEFTYLKVGEVKTLSDVNEDGINGDIELIYGADTELMDILGLKAYDPATKGTGLVAVTQVDGINYFTSQQINDALKAALEVGTYNGSYATSEEIGQDTDNATGSRLDNEKGITVKDALETYITKAGNAHAAGTAMAETDANGLTGAKDLDLIIL